MIRDNELYRCPGCNHRLYMGFILHKNAAMGFNGAGFILKDGVGNSFLIHNGLTVLP